jgi:G3E family GTPase
MLSLRQLSRLGLNVHIVATYDCVRSPLTSETFKDAVSQLGAAHVIVLTKVDLASETQRLLARNAVMEVNPHARVVDHPALAHRARAAFLESVPTSGHVSAPLSDSIVRDGLLHPRIRVFSATFGEMPVWDQTLDWLEDVAGATGDRLLRAKAIVPGPYGHDRVLIQSVGTTFSPPRRLVNPALGAEASAVFIVRDCRLFEMEATGSNLGITWTQLPHAGATMWFGDHLREKDDAF